VTEKLCRVRFSGPVFSVLDAEGITGPLKRTPTGTVTGTVIVDDEARQDLSRYRDLNDDALLAQCRWEAYRGSGPGGQKRNKTSSSIRLTHEPSGIHVIAAESRSQAENKLRAFRRLRLRLAVELRRPIDPRGYEPPDWIDEVRGVPDRKSPSTARRLQVSYRNPLYPATIGLVLDLLAARAGAIADVASLLGVSTSSLVRLLHEEPSAWGAANRIRKDAAQPPLTPPR
jgi:hypothetical protein